MICNNLIQLIHEYFAKSNVRVLPLKTEAATASSRQNKGIILPLIYAYVYLPLISWVFIAAEKYACFIRRYEFLQGSGKEISSRGNVNLVDNGQECEILYIRESGEGWFLV